MTEDGDRVLNVGDPVFEGESIATGTNANLEIRFLDGTLLGQGEEARVDLDSYIFDGSDSGLDFHMVAGVLRLVSGKIAETNPEAFNLSTPLATVGIRGTEIIAKIDVNGQIVGVTDMSPGHYVVVATAEGEIRIDVPGLFSGVDSDGFLIPSQPLPQDFVDAVQDAVPLTELGEDPRDPDAPPPEFSDPTGADGEQDDPTGDTGDGTEGEGDTGQDDVPDSGGEPEPLSLQLGPQGTQALGAPETGGPDGEGESESSGLNATQSSDEDDTTTAKDEDVVDDDPETTGGEVWEDTAEHAASHTGTAYADSISGLDLDDTLYGEAGDDSIDGGTGKDFIEGDAGTDSLIGGQDADTFFFSSTSEGTDDIGDFGYGDDKIGLDSSADGFSHLTFNNGILSASNFYSYVGDEYPGTAVLDGPTVAVVYASDSGSTEGKLYFDPDTTTSGDEVLLANITEVDTRGEVVDNNLDSSDIVESVEPGVV